MILASLLGLRVGYARRKFMTATENDFQKETIAKFTAIMAMDNEADQLAGEVKLDFRRNMSNPW